MGYKASVQIGIIQNLLKEGKKKLPIDQIHTPELNCCLDSKEELGFFKEQEDLKAFICDWHFT